MEIKKLNAFDLESFSIQLYSADIDIEQSDSTNIEIETDALIDQDYEIIQKQKNIELNEKKKSFINFGIFSSTKYFKIKVPVRLSLYISLSSGDLNIVNKVNKKNDNKDYFDTKTIDIRLISGDFSAENISSSIFIFSSTSSDFSMSDSKIGKSRIKGISSDIYLKDCYVDEIEAKSISGDINFNLLNFNKISADLKSGDINIICPKSKINVNVKTLSGDIDIEGIEVDKNIPIPYISLYTLSGDITIKGKYDKSEIKIISDSPQPIVSAFEDYTKKDEKEKFIQLLLDGKIAEKDAVELLKGFGFSDSEIDSIFEEYLFRRANKGKKGE